MTDQQQAKPSTIDDLRDALAPVWASAKRLIETGIATLNEAGIDVGTLGDPDPDTEPVDVATARDQVVTAALRYAAAEGDAGTSLADTNTALTVLDDALAGYVDATGWHDKPPTVPTVEALRPGNEVAFTVRGFVGDDYVTIPAGTGDICDSMRVQFVAEAGCDFRVIRRAEAAE